MDNQKNKSVLESGKAVLGIEFGSTRIKAVVVNEANEPIAQGSHEWENELSAGIWTYSLAAIHNGLEDCYRDLKENVKKEYGVTLTSFAAMGFSGMMHGYMAFSEEGKLLVPFRTWRNTITAEASEELTNLFGFHIPQRWSIAHLYQAMLKKEDHVKDVAFFTTLAGYIHLLLTGKKVLGVGEASGMFPIDSATGNFDAGMIDKFEKKAAEMGMPWKLSDILPAVLTAGEDAGALTSDGALLLDPTGDLKAGIPLCPPEGDAGTGMVATNSVAVRTGNVSAGTSVFGMIVMEKPLSKVYDEIDLVTTPDGHPVAMAHCNNCTSDLNAWVGMFKEFADLAGCKMDMGDLFTMLYKKALEGDADCGDLLAFNYLSGEHITGMEEGRPLFVRTPDAKFTLANFMRTHLYAALGVLKSGLDILFVKEGVQVDEILGHGGFFKTKGVGQGILAAALNTPVSVMETAGEGGAWGIAILASYMIQKNASEKLGDYLNRAVFAGAKGSRMEPDPKAVEGFKKFMERYNAGLAVERAAVDNL